MSRRRRPLVCAVDRLEACRPRGPLLRFHELVAQIDQQVLVRQGDADRAGIDVAKNGCDAHCSRLPCRTDSNADDLQNSFGLVRQSFAAQVCHPRPRPLDGLELQVADARREEDHPFHQTFP